MDTSALISEAVKALAPALPFLVEAAHSTTKLLAEKLGEATAETARQLWEWLHPKAENRPALREAIVETATHFDDEDVRGTLRLQLRKLLAEQPALVNELQGIVGPLKIHSETATASGTASIAVTGGISGSRISTNVNK